MAPDVADPTEVAADAEVMAAVEQGTVERLVIADLNRDDSYVTVPLAEAASLPAWR